jgi:truncated hemoglobin YjbI
MAKPNGQTGKSQSEKFKEAAREVGADESEETFMDKLKRIAKHKPKKDKSGK